MKKNIVKKREENTDSPITINRIDKFKLKKLIIFSIKQSLMVGLKIP